MKPDAPQRHHELREVYNALRWIVRAGAPWRRLPTNFLPWEVVYQQTQRWGGSQFDRSNGSSWAMPMPMPMPIDVYATADHAVLIAAVPGMQPDDLDLTVHHNTVTLRGTIQSTADAEETRDATWYVSELGSGTYQRSVTLLFPVDADQANATFAHGLVRVTLPKADSANPKKIAIHSTAEQALAATTA
jgi:HSP20 family molecular chaperone IbpA